VALDTVVPRAGHGSLCAHRLAWLDDTLAAAPEVPTMVAMHHPPFATGIAHMDAIGLREGADGLAAVLRRHPQVERVICGHLHRPIVRRFGGTLAMTVPSTAHQIVLDLRAGGPAAWRMEPPGFAVHTLSDGALVSHGVTVGDHGPVGRY
jgi:3',5'-cyclic AMP phosphodiesterase CpdA